MSSAFDGCRSLREVYPRINRRQYLDPNNGKLIPPPIWAKCDEKTRNFSKKSIERMQGKKGRAVILAAGPCFEVQLETICQAFNEVLLVDADLEIVNASISTLDRSLRSKVRTVKADVSFFLDELTTAMGGIIERLDGTENPESIKATLKKDLSTFLKLKWFSVGKLDLENESVDFVISSSVLGCITQAHISWLDYLFNKKFGMDFFLTGSEQIILDIIKTSISLHLFEISRIMRPEAVCNIFSTISKGIVVDGSVIMQPLLTADGIVDSLVKFGIDPSTGNAVGLRELVRENDPKNCLKEADFDSIIVYSDSMPRHFSTFSGISLVARLGCYHELLSLQKG